MIQIERSSKDALKIQVLPEKLGDQTYLDFRVWYIDENDGQLKPTKRGFGLNARHLDELIEGLEKIKKDLQAPR